MSQQVTQNVIANIVVILTKDNVPVTGIVYSAVTVKYRKEGGSSFTTKSIGATDFAEIGSGVYTIKFTAAELNTVGSFVITVTSASIDQSVTICQVIPTTQTSVSISLETCVVFGYIADLSGNPLEGVAVSARVLGMPSIEQNIAAVTDDLVSVKTDANGEFFLPLVRLADVEIFIPAVNYRRTLVVPNADSANLFTGIP